MIDWWGPILLEYYAGTEANGFCYIDSPTWLAHPGSVGQSLLGTIHICDEDGQRAADRRGRAPSTSSVTRCRSSTTTTPRRPQDAQHPEHPNWSTLGDIGYVDEEGFLYLTDRKAFMIISRWGEHLPAGDRGRAGHAPEGGRRGRLRRPQRGDGRGGEGGRPAGRGGRGGPGPGASAVGLRPGAPRPLQGAALHRLRGRAAPPADRQAVQARARATATGPATTRRSCSATPACARHLWCRCSAVHRVIAACTGGAFHADGAPAPSAEVFSRRRRRAARRCRPS